MKEKIRLIDKVEYEIDNIICFDNLLKIIFPDTVNIEDVISNMSAFERLEILTRNKEVCGRYDDFTTVYLCNGQELILSNDGSVYVKPDIEDPSTDIPNIAPIEPTIEDIRIEKINYFSDTCNNLIEYGVDVEIDGKNEHFSYTLEDQSNLDTAVDMANLTGLDVPYHADNMSCRLFTPDQIKKIYVTAKTNLTHHQTYFNQMKCYINTLEDKEEILGLSYGDELKGEFLETYNLIMEQSKAIITSLFKEVRW